VFLLLALTACKEAAEDAFRRGAYDRSLAAFATRAEGGDADALNYLGVHYYLGLGVDRDPARAAGLFERAAIAGHRGACRNLGILYLRGLGVKQDRVKAYAWFFAGFEAGDALAFKYLEYAADYITPNQSMAARRWVIEFLRDARI
jgi:TPR repeat protein